MTWIETKRNDIKWIHGRRKWMKDARENEEMEEGRKDGITYRMDKWVRRKGRKNVWVIGKGRKKWAKERINEGSREGISRYLLGQTHGFPSPDTLRECMFTFNAMWFRGCGARVGSLQGPWHRQQFLLADLAATPKLPSKVCVYFLFGKRGPLGTNF